MNLNVIYTIFGTHGKLHINAMLWLVSPFTVAYGSYIYTYFSFLLMKFADLVDFVDILN